MVDLTLPQNASIFATDRAAKKLDAMLEDNPDVASWSAYVGRGAIRFYLPLNVQLANDFFAQAVIIAKDVSAREQDCTRGSRRNSPTNCPASSRAFRRWSSGPPVGWPVQYRVSGPDLSQVRMIALQLGAILGANNDLRRVNYDWMEPARKLRVVIDQDQARLLGLSSQALSSYLNTVMTGAPITQVRDDIYLVDVVAPRPGRAARVARHLAIPAGSAAERAHRAAEPDRAIRISAGISAGAGGATARRP